MIYIIDNGRDYSSHEIIFVDTDVSLDLVERFVRASWSGDGKIVAISDVFEWRVDRRLTLVEGCELRLLGWGANNRRRYELIDAWMAEESIAHLMKQAASEEKERLHRLDFERNYRNRPIPGGGRYADLNWDPPTPIIDELVRRGIIDPTTCAPV